VAEWLGVQAHVLRFWESKFTQVKPIKRAGGRRYYRPADMLLLGGIRKLLHDDGMSIKEVQAILRDLGISHVSEMSHSLDATAPGEQPAANDSANAGTTTSSTVAKEEPETIEGDAPEDVGFIPSSNEPLDSGKSPSESHSHQASGEGDRDAPNDTEHAENLASPDATGDETDTEVAVEAASPAGQSEPVRAEPDNAEAEVTSAPLTTTDDINTQTPPSENLPPAEADPFAESEMAVGVPATDVQQPEQLQEGADDAADLETPAAFGDDDEAATAAANSTSVDLAEPAEPEQFMMDLGSPDPSDSARSTEEPAALAEVSQASDVTPFEPAADESHLPPQDAPESVSSETDAPILGTESAAAGDPPSGDAPVFTASDPAPESLPQSEVQLVDDTAAAITPLSEEIGEPSAAAEDDEFSADTSITESAPQAPLAAEGAAAALPSTGPAPLEDQAPLSSEPQSDAAAADQSKASDLESASLTGSAPRIIAVPDEDLAAQVNLRPGLLALLAQTTQIPPQSRDEVAGCVAELRGWLDGK
jgi:DNA-binding transcriptional MerR regulator